MEVHWIYSSSKQTQYLPEEKRKVKKCKATDRNVGKSHLSESPSGLLCY